MGSQTNIYTETQNTNNNIANIQTHILHTWYKETFEREPSILTYTKTTVSDCFIQKIKKVL